MRAQKSLNKKGHWIGQIMVSQSLEIISYHIILTPKKIRQTDAQTEEPDIVIVHRGTTECSFHAAMNVQLSVHIRLT